MLRDGLWVGANASSLVLHELSVQHAMMQALMAQQGFGSRPALFDLSLSSVSRSSPSLASSLFLPLFFSTTSREYVRGSVVE